MKTDEMTTEQMIAERDELELRGDQMLKNGLYNDTFWEVATRYHELAAIVGYRDGLD